MKNPCTVHKTRPVSHAVRALTLACVMLFASTAFTGCSSAARPSSGSGQTADGSLEKAAESGILTTTVSAAQEKSLQDTSPGKASAAAAPSSSVEGRLSEDTVTVSSKGSVYAVPDRAELRFGIRTQAETALQAQQENSRTVDSVIDTLKQNGIREENIQTTMYDVSPQYDWNTGDGNSIIGYNVYSSLSVKDVVIEDAGKLITAGTEAGANEFNGISYSCTNYSSLYSEALQKAVSASKEKAETLASAAGRSLGSVRTIAEGYQDMTYYAASNAKAISAYGMEEAAMDSGSSASLMPGEAEITAAVTVTYSLQ